MTTLREAAQMALDAEKVRNQLDYDPQTGLMKLKISGKGYVKGRVVGSKDKRGYIQYRFNGKFVRLHRLIWLHYYGEWPKHEIDHINGDKSDNRISNLRDVPRILNMQNRHKPLPNNKLGITGVKMKGTKYQAQIRLDGRMKHLGMFDTAEAASKAYIAAKQEFHKGYLYGK